MVPGALLGAGGVGGLFAAAGSVHKSRDNSIHKLMAAHVSALVRCGYWVPLNRQANLSPHLEIPFRQ